MQIAIREAEAADREAIVGLVAELARTEQWPLELRPGYVATYLAFPGTTVLLAEDDGMTLGLLAFSVRPGLFHGGESGFVEELVVAPAARRQGVARALLQEALRRIENAGCREVSIATGCENHEAQRLYRRLGLVEESLLLEKHLPPSP